MLNVKKIKSRMKEQDISKAQLIRDSGLTRVTIDKILKGGEITVSTLEALAKGLDVKIGFFFDEEVQADVQNQLGGKQNTQNKAGRDVINGMNMAEHDELIRLREDVKSLNRQLKEKEDKLKEAKDGKDRELAAKDAIIEELRASLDRVQKMNDYLMGQK